MPGSSMYRPGQTVQMWARVGYAAVLPAPLRRLQDCIQA